MLLCILYHRAVETSCGGRLHSFSLTLDKLRLEGLNRIVCSVEVCGFVYNLVLHQLGGIFRFDYLIDLITR